MEQYLTPTQLLELSDVSNYFSNPRDIGQFVSIWEKTNNNILKTYRTRDGNKIEKHSFVNFIKYLNEYPATT